MSRPQEVKEYFIYQLDQALDWEVLEKVEEVGKVQLKRWGFDVGERQRVMQWKSGSRNVKKRKEVRGNRVLRGKLVGCG